MMRNRGFTLIELMVVIMLIAIVAAVSVPAVSRSIGQSKEAALRENLRILRKAIDDYRADTGAYPIALTVLEERRYLRKIPLDPLLEQAQWALTYTKDGDGIVDIHSQSTARAGDGSAYASW